MSFIFKYVANAGVRIHVPSTLRSRDFFGQEVDVPAANFARAQASISPTKHFQPSLGSQGKPFQRLCSLSNVEDDGMIIRRIVQRFLVSTSRSVRAITLVYQMQEESDASLGEGIVL